MNEHLQSCFTAEEVHEVIKQMAPLKSPSPDGFSTCFYQAYWPIVGQDFCKGILKFLNEGTFDDSLNFTSIVLIPKTKTPTIPKDYKPISLCNVLYKAASKVIANHLKSVLPVIISKSQSTFIPGRLITDNIIIAFKALHTMTT